MGKSRPNRYSRPTAHADYGINNWFDSQGIEGANVRQRIKTAFLLDNGFKQNHLKKRGVKNIFISNRFEKFKKYVQQNRKIFEQQTKPS